MNIRDLRYLVALAEVRSFTRAAEKCHVSQPTLSGQIKKIEADLDVVIFERCHKEVRLSAEGEEIIAAARRALNEVNTIYEIGKSVKDPYSGKLTIGAFPTLSPYFFPRIIPRISALYPNLHLVLIEEKTDQLVRKLKSGELDLAFLALPVRELGLASRHLFNDQFFIAVADDHELASTPHVHQALLAKYRIMLLEEGHCLRDQALDICSQYRVSEEADFRATSLETLRQMVKAGTGITFMPQIAAAPEPGITYITLADQCLHRQIGMVWRQNSAKIKKINLVYEAIRDIGDELYGQAELAPPAKPAIKVASST